MMINQANIIKKEEINLDNYINYSLNDINQINDNKIKIEILKVYQAELKYIKKYTELDPKQTLIEMQREVEHILNKQIENDYQNISQLIWPGAKVYVYPSIRVFKTRKTRLCHMCSRRILKGKRYEIYRPLLYNFNLKKAYIMEPNIVVSYSCRHYLPTNIQEIEQIQLGINSSYNFLNEDNPYKVETGIDEIDFQEFHYNVGGDFRFIPLRKAKEKTKT